LLLKPQCRAFLHILSLVWTDLCWKDFRSAKKI